MAIEINISNISLQKSTEILLSGSRYIILMSCFLATMKLSAQSDLNLQDVVVGKVEVSATHSITLGPGFHAKEGSTFHAFIGSTSQPQNSTTTISSPSANATPAAGSSDNNNIKSITYREAKTTIPTGSFEHLEEIQYFDGLGRPIQTIMVGASPSGQDIIQPVLYDGYDREAIKTLPYTADKSGEFRTGVIESTVNSYYSPNPPTGVISDSRAYTKFDFDNSPLNRVVSQTGPGSDWETNSKRIITHYLSNSSSIPGWSVTSNYSYSSFTYAANTLYVTETIDEDGHYSREYKDKLGQVVLKESQLGSNWLQTFYIYDDFGLLRCVMPPEATNPDTETDLCYNYLYDSRKRLTEKKLPGGGTIKMVYDARDRLRATQNSLQAPNNEWTFTKYDVLNRPVITGTIINSGNIQSAIDVAPMNETHSNPTYYGYDNNSYPTSGATILTATYYDHYDFISTMNLSDSLHSYTFDSGNYNFASITDPEPKGYVTGMMSRVMYSSADNGSVPKSELFTATYYDKYGHVLRSISENQLKGKDVVSNLYQDITYLILQTKQEHHKGSENIIIEKWFEYDHTGRILATREKVNDQQEITSSAMKYNEIGEMTTKYLHSMSHA
jgi:YD repeat-containing protein